MKLNHRLLAKVAGLKFMDSGVVERLESFADLLLEANRKINLISRAADPQAELQNQILISVLAGRFSEENTSTWIDIGSGGGFPVVPLAVLYPRVSFSAVEPVAKKAYFIERSCQALGLDNLKVIASTVEEFITSGTSREYSMVSIKAVTSLDQSFRWATLLLSHGGLLITFKPNTAGVKEESSPDKFSFKYNASLYVKDFVDTADLEIISYRKS